MEHTRDWRKKTEEISAHEGPLESDLYDDDNNKRVTILTPSSKDEVKEAEVVAPLTLAPDGGWGWMVLVCSFMGISIIDGLMYSYGPLLPEVVKELKISASFGALNNSLLIATVYLVSPVSSALINRFGFRRIGMCGSIVCSLAWFAAYFTRTYASLLILYAIVAGAGLSMVSLALSLVVGFYFDKLRTLALGVASCGSSAGIMTFYPINVFLVSKGGWRTTLLFHSGICGLLYFLSLSLRPLPTINVTAEPERRESVRPFTYLPNMATTIEDKSLAPTITEKAMKTPSNAYFPHATNLIDATTAEESAQPGPSAALRHSRIGMVVTNSVDFQQMRKIRKQMSMPDHPDVIFQKQMETKKGCCGNCCDWEESSEARPIYRDDVFYNASKKALKEYRKSHDVPRESYEKRASVDGVKRKSLLLTRDTAAEAPPEDTTGLKYQLAVMRVATTKDLEERKMLCPTAVRRALATILDPSLLKRGSFLLFCLTGFLLNLGILVPYVYLEPRAIAKGLDPTSSALLVSVASLANLVGRIISSLVAMKVSPVNVYGVTLVVTGVATMMSGLSYALVFQMAYCVVFGFFVSAASCLRAVVVVELYGLQNLTGGTGMALMFNGMANVISTPLAGALITSLGFETAFYVSGMFITLAGIVVVPLKLKFYLERRASVTPSKRSIIMLIDKHETNERF